MDIVPLERLQLREEFPGGCIDQTTVKPLALKNELLILYLKSFKRCYRKTSINTLVICVSTVPIQSEGDDH